MVWPAASVQVVIHKPSMSSGWGHGRHPVPPALRPAFRPLRFTGVGRSVAIVPTLLCAGVVVRSFMSVVHSAMGVLWCRFPASGIAPGVWEPMFYLSAIACDRISGSAIGLVLCEGVCSSPAKAAAIRCSCFHRLPPGKTPRHRPETGNEAGLGLRPAIPPAGCVAVKTPGRL